MIDAVLRREALAHHAQSVDESPGRHDLLADHAVRIHHVHHLARLVRDDGLIGHEQRVERLPIEQAHLAEHAGRDETLGVVDDGAQADRARAAVERVVEEVDAALPAIFGLVLQADLDLAVARAVRLALVLQQRGFRRIEHEADRILADDRRQQRRVGRHDVARPPGADTTHGPRVGAVTRVNERFSSCVCTAASAAASVGGGLAAARRCAGRPRPC